MMTGVPVVSIGPSHMQIAPYGSQLFEGHEIAGAWSDSPERARVMLHSLLVDDEGAVAASQEAREKAKELFGMDTIAKQWGAFLG
jgi:hypothetical protein